MAKQIVLYHTECLDGFSGAWAAWKKLGDSAEYIAIRHNDPLPVQCVDAEVFLIDIVYPLETFKELIAKNKRVVALDHHKTTTEIIKHAAEWRHDVAHAGSTIAWEYFHPGKSVPKLLKIVEISDLFLIATDEERELITSLSIAQFSFKNWDTLAEEFENAEGIAAHRARGRAMRDYQEALTSQILSKMSPGKFEGLCVGIVNTTVLKSLVSEKIWSNKDFDAALIWYRYGNIVKVSLRSVPRTGKDVSGIAEKYNGGGHPNAAGFVLKADKPLPWTYDDAK